MRRNLLLVVERIDIFDQLPKTGQATVVRRELLHICEIEVDRPFVRRQFERPLERLRRLLESAESLIGNAKVVVGPEARWVALQSKEVLLDRFFEAVELEIGVAEIAERVGIGWIDLLRRLVMRDGAFLLTEPQVRVSDIVVGFGMLRI